MGNRQTYLILFLFLSVFAGRAQEFAYNGNPDASFFVARDLAFDGQRAIARDTLRRILTKYPGYTDVRELLAKTHSWDGNYDEARRHFNKITSVERKNRAVWTAAVKNEMYAENYPIALGLANKALLYLEGDEDMLLLRTRILEKINNTEEKEGITEGEAVVLEKEAVKKDSLETKAPKNSITVSNSFEIFDVVFDPMVYGNVSYKRDTDAGSIIPRINFANRFEVNGLQYEVDFYPKFSKTFYAYLNYGYSNASIFPDHRVGAELYANLPKSLEASLGIRYLDFDSSKVSVLTGSFGLYKGNYYFSLRPYITPSKDDPTSFSGNLLVRKYFKDADNYLGLNAGMGIAPELNQLRAGDELLSETLLFIESQRLLLEYQFTGKNTTNIYTGDLGLTRQELVFDPGRFFWAVSAGIRYNVKF